MPRVLQVREVAERALRMIGAFSINDEGADPAELDEAMFWLDMLVGRVGARQRAWWLVPVTRLVPLTAGQEAYDLAALLAEQQGIQAVVSVRRVARLDGREEALEEGQDGAGVLRRTEWEALDRIAPAGVPRAVHIDRAERPTLRVWPKPASPPTHDLRIVYQRFTADVTALGPTQRVPDVRQTWNLYLVVALAAWLGNGPVRKLPADEIRDLQQREASLLDELEAFDAQEQAAEPRRVAYNDF